MMKIKVLVFLVGLFSTQMVAGIIDGQCDDTIYNTGKDIHVRYHNNKYKFLKRCKKSSKKKNWWIPHKRGKSCADSRVDGCSYGKASFAFTKRDKKLMTPSCNEHDLCYSTNGNTKDQCDKDFRKNLEKTKAKFQGGFEVDVLYDAVVLFGKSGYKGGQKWGKKHECTK